MAASLPDLPALATELPVAVYTPAPALRAPGRLLAEMVRDLRASRELAWRLFVRDLASRYRQSLLGVTWSFAPPLLTGLIFVALHDQAVIDLGPTNVPYPLFALVGTLYWQVFVEALNAPLRSVSDARRILTKINLPREALILSALYGVLFDLLLKSAVLAGILLWFGVSLGWGVLLAPIPVAVLIGLGLGLGTMLTPLGLLYTDVASGLAVVTQLWFFATPVVYAAPESGALAALQWLNPVAVPLEAARDLTTRGVLASPEALAVVAIGTVALLLGSWVLYRLAMPVLVERMSA